MSLPFCVRASLVHRWVACRRALLSAGMMLLAVGMAGCKPAPQADGSAGPGAGAGEGRKTEIDPSRVRVALLSDHQRTPLRNFQMQLLNSWIRSKPKVDVVETDAADHATAQAQQVRAVTQEGANVIMVFPLLSDELIASLAEAKNAGVQIISFDVGLPSRAVTSTISMDQREIGRLAGDFTVKALSQKAHDEGFSEVRGRVVQLRGDEQGGDSELINQGFTEALKKEPGIVLVHDAPGNWNDVEAAMRMHEASRLQMPFQVIFAHNDLMAKGASAVAKEAGVRDSLLIMGVDGAPGSHAGMDMVRQGELEATVYRPPLVDIAWVHLQKWLENRDYAWPEKIEVKPFVMTMQEASNHTGKGLPEPLLK